jgi:hypothetical protein
VLPVLAALVLSPAAASGQQPAGPPKRIVVPEFRNAPLRKVLTWLSEKSGKPVILQFRPTGVFNFVPPNPPRTYTLPEVMDIINEGLLSDARTQKYHLVRDERGFRLMPADKEIDDALIPRIVVAELKERGQLELVSVVVRCWRRFAVDLAPEVRKMIGPFGDVEGIESQNILILRGRAGNLHRICRMLDHFR